jgi:predicted HTH domain antitoxin
MEIIVEIPVPLSDRSTQELATRARLLLVIDEVRAGRLTRAGGARALNMTLDEFLVEAGRHGLDAIDYDVEDFKRELGAIPKPAR